MVISKFEDLARFDGLNPHFAKAFDWILAGKFADASAGRVEIDGEKIFANAQEYAPHSLSNGDFETHKKYIDIQFVVSGIERIDWARASSLREKSQYDAERDVAFFAGDAEGILTLRPGVAVIFFPEDAHRCCLRVSGDEQRQNKKVCVKIRIE